MSNTVIKLPQTYDATPENRRRHERNNLRMFVRCTQVNRQKGSMLDHLETFDVSHGGMGALSDQRYHAGERILVHMPRNTDGSFRHVFARVAWCRGQDSGQYQVGLEFETESCAAQDGIRLAA
mgnify:CR=1 FL=1